MTDLPRLFYVDPAKMIQKGEIPWSNKMRPELKSNRLFIIKTPQRTYFLEDIACNAQRWVNAIQIVKRQFGTPSSVSSSQFGASMLPS